jgi:hypothetical protein
LKQDSAIGSISEGSDAVRHVMPNTSANAFNFTTSVVCVIPITWSHDHPEFGIGAFHPLLCGGRFQMSGASDTAPPSYSDSVAAGQESVFVVTRSNIQ